MDASGEVTSKFRSSVDWVVVGTITWLVPRPAGWFDQVIVSGDQSEAACWMVKPLLPELACTRSPVVGVGSEYRYRLADLIVAVDGIELRSNLIRPLRVSGWPPMVQASASIDWTVGPQEFT